MNSSTTLTKSEKGILPDIELIGKPQSFSHETVFDDNQPPLVNYPWDQSQYVLIFFFFQTFQLHELMNIRI